MPAALGPSLFAGVLKFLGYIAINIGIAKLQKAMQKRPTRVLQKIDVEYVGSLEPRRRLYGYFRAAGLNTLPAITSGPQGKRLHKILTISDGEIEAIDAVILNNDRITSTTATGTTYEGKFFFSPHLGLASQVADSAAIAVGGWDSNHRGDGVAYVYMYFDADNEVYKQGLPNVVIEGQGAIVYDPRLDSSPGADPTNASFKAFTTNAALISADFLIWGCAELAANIDWDDVVAVANISDEDVDVPDGIGGSTTQKRFTCSVEAYAPLTGAERDETIKMLARSFMGVIWWSGSKWKMRAGVYASPSFTLVDDDFLGDKVNIATAPPRASGQSFNTVRGSFVDQDGSTQPRSVPEVSTASYVTDDGERIYADAEFKTARTVYEAERNAILLLRQSRRRVVIAASFRFKAWDIDLYDTGTCTCSKVGWVEQTVRVIGIRLLPNFLVELRLQELSSGDFTDPEVSDYLTPDAVSAPPSDDYQPNPPRNLTAQSSTNAIILTWQPPEQAPVGVLYRIYEYSSPTPFSSASQVGFDTPQTSIVISRTGTTTSYFWVVAVEPTTGVTSSPAPPSNGVPAGASSVSATLSAIVAPGSAVIDGYSASLQTDEVFVTPSGGTSPYTYATSFTSGGSGITINDGTTSSPYFSATGLSEGESRSGTARIRVTDNVAATVDVFVAVTISRGFTVALDDTTINASGGLGGPGSPGSAAVTAYVVASGGGVSVSPGPGSYQWINPSADSADYDVRYTLLSGTIASGNLGVWQQLDVSREVVATRTPAEGAGTSVTTITVEIRLHASPFTVLDTATLTMNRTIS